MFDKMIEKGEIHVYTFIFLIFLPLKLFSNKRQLQKILSPFLFNCGNLGPLKF